MADFPVYSHQTVSSFTGADETPISEGGMWTAFAGWNTTAQRVGNQFGISTGDYGSAVLRQDAADGLYSDFEAIASIAAWDAVNQAFNINARLFSASGSPLLSTINGYAMSASASGTLIERMTAGVATSLATGTNPFATGDKLGLALRRSYLAIWRLPSGGSWTEIAAANDSTYSSGWFSLGGFGTTLRFDDLTVGVPSVGLNLTKFPRPVVRSRA